MPKRGYSNPMARGGMIRSCTGQVFISLCLCILFWIWTILSYMGLNSKTINDLLINQEISQVSNSGQRIQNDFSPFIRHGLDVMKSSNVTFMGVARNAADKLPSILYQLDTLSQHFSSSRAIIAYGDSSDDTAHILNVWAANSPTNRTILHIQSAAGGDKEQSGTFKGALLPREGRIAKARNAILDYLHLLTPSTYLLTLDLDIVGWDNSGIVDSFGRDSWDVMCAHGILLHGIYRDTYAFRTEGVNTNHHWAGKDHLAYNISLPQYSANRKKLKLSQQKAREIMDNTFSTSLEPVQVESCFGGLAIYRSSAVGGCRYGYRYEEPPYMLDCEHVLFNRCIREGMGGRGGRVLSNFNMKLWYGHSAVETLSLKKILSSVSSF